MRVIGISLIFSLLLGNEFGKTIPQNYACANDGIDAKRVYAQVRAIHRHTRDTTRPMFTAFKSLEEIDTSATLIDIAAFAKKRFGDHPLADEWVKLCFHLRRNKKGSSLELKRFAKLQIQMLADVDASKYAEEIAAYQGTLKELDIVAKHSKNRIHFLPLDIDVDPELAVEQNQITVIYDWDPEMLKHLAKFQSLHRKDPRAARAKITTVAKICFEDHPLADEWCALYFRLSRNGKGTVSDVKRLSELEIRMFTDLGAKKHDELIQKHRGLIERYDKFVKMLKDAGKNHEVFQVDFKSAN